MIVVLLNLKKGGSFMTQNKKGILCMLASVLLFSFMQLFISMTGPDASVFHQIFFRNLLGITWVFTFPGCGLISFVMAKIFTAIF